MRDKTTRRFVLLTLVCMAALSFVAYGGMFIASVYEEVDLLDDYLSSLPGILEDREVEFRESNEAYIDDCVVRGELAEMLYDEFSALDMDERLAEVKDAVSALDVSLVDEDGTIVATTRTEESLELTSEQLKDAISHKRSFVDRTFTLGYILPENLPAKEKDTTSASEEGEEEEGPELVPYPALSLAKTDDGQTLVTELDYATMAQVNAERAAWDSILARMLSGLDASAFVWVDAYKGWVGYPYATEEELNAIEADVDALFANVPTFTKAEDTDDPETTRFGVGAIGGVPQLVASMRLEDKGYTALIAVPIRNFLSGSTKSSMALAAFLCLNVVLLAWYLRFSSAGASAGDSFAEKDTDEKDLLASSDLSAEKSGAEKVEPPDGVLSLEKDVPAADESTAAHDPVPTSLFRRAMPALLTVLIASLGFAAMLVLLEAMSMNATKVASQQFSLQYEIDYNDDARERIVAEHRDRNVTRAGALARLMSDKPQLRRRAALQRLAKVVGADYLMLYDADGHELFASNAYSDFEVGELGEGFDEPYASVLKGHPYAVTEPATDAMTGVTTTTVASLITDSDGLADGMLVMSMDYADVKSKLKSLELTGAVGTFSTQTDQVVIAVDNASGRIVAHTDKGKVGVLAADYVPEGILGRDYEGFTWYDHEYAYIAESADDDASVLVVSMHAFDASLVWLFLPLMLVAILVPLVVYYALASWLVDKADKRRLGHSRLSRWAARFENPLMVFAYGYAVFLAAMAVIAILIVRGEGWHSLSFVVRGQWAGGIHLFSLWAALFTVSVAMCAVMVVRAVLKRLIGGASTQATTLLRLTDSLVSYAAVIAAFCIVLSMFGVDTTTLLASAGIVSIAIGMGAQSLIADILAGLFIIFEGTVHVGDEVSIGGWSGHVTDMGIRTCKITNDEGDVKIITNSRINDVINMSHDGQRS